jgi:hypothetical protein
VGVCYSTRQTVGPKNWSGLRIAVKSARLPGVLYERYCSGVLCDPDRHAQRAGVERSVHDSDLDVSSVEEEAVFIEI